MSRATKGTSEAVQKARSKNAASIAYILYGIIKWQRRCAIQLAKAGAAAQQLFTRMAASLASGAAVVRARACARARARACARARARARAVLVLVLVLVPCSFCFSSPSCSSCPSWPSFVVLVRGPRCQRCAGSSYFFCLRACPPAGRAAQGEPPRDSGQRSRAKLCAHLLDVPICLSGLRRRSTT